MSFQSVKDYLSSFLSSAPSESFTPHDLTSIVVVDGDGKTVSSVPFSLETYVMNKEPDHKDPYPAASVKRLAALRTFQDAMDSLYRIQQELLPLLKDPDAKPTVEAVLGQVHKVLLEFESNELADTIVQALREGKFSKVGVRSLP